MSPVALNIFRSIPSNLELNGPLLSFTEDPVSSSESATGVVTFTGICTAGYPVGMGLTADGTFTFRWYLGETEVIDTATIGSGNASIVSTNGEQIGISTLTLTGMSYTDNGKVVYVTADYNPVGVGASLYLGNTEANAINEPLKSAEAVLTTYSEIVISSQPVSQTVGTGANATFAVEASIIPDNNTDIQYQWQLNYVDLADGQIDGTQYVTSPVQAKFTIDDGLGGRTEVDWETLSTYSTFISGREYTITTDQDFQAKIYAVGAKGGRSDIRDVRGGDGGVSQGNFTFLAGTSYILQVGMGGQKGGNGGTPGGGNGGSGYGRGGGGGGYTGLFVGSVSQENAILIAGGGGGGSNDPAIGGMGGGVPTNQTTYANTGAEGGDGGSSGNPGRGGLGGTNLAGGTGGDTGHGSRGDAGSALRGGAGAAGGGAGYFGGGGGGRYSSGCCADGSGGGGSGFIHPTLVTEGKWSIVDSAYYNNTQGDLRGDDGTFKIDRVATVERITTTVSGATTPTLTLNSSSSDVGGPIRCKLTNAGSQPTVVYTDVVSYSLVSPRNLLKFEAFYGSEMNTASTELSDTTSYTLLGTNFGTNYSIIQFHAPEKSFLLGMTLNGAAGAAYGRSAGGQGGKSDIRFNIDQNVEYTLIGVANNSAIYLYRGSTLIAVAGQGGNGGGGAAGQLGNGGGRGGGCEVAGEIGGGRGGGSGGSRLGAGDLNLTGVWGSLAGATGAINSNLLEIGDSIASGTSGGRTVSCSKGSYWLDQQIGACANNGVVRYRDPSGTEVLTSSLITRGFKPGYTVTNTGGNKQREGCGNGGAGATGGAGGTGQAGGGGGSGFSDGSITVASTQLGGNDSTTASVLFYIPSLIEQVQFNISRSAAYTNIIQFQRQSGEGPDLLTFGPNTSQQTHEIAFGSVYTLRGVWVNGNGFRTDQLRLFNNNKTLGLEDIAGGGDNDYNDLMVSCNHGQFTTIHRWEFV